MLDSENAVASVEQDHAALLHERGLELQAALRSLEASRQGEVEATSHADKLRLALTA
ncbi:MAG: hypothetical protein SGPRY_014863, partial [Prymnesium sp.]